MQVIAWTIDANYDEAVRVVDPLVEGIPIGPALGTREAGWFSVRRDIYGSRPATGGW